MSNSTVCQHQKYWWDADGNLTERTDVLAYSETESFSYDFLDRITGVSSAYSESYDYDEIGNMTSKNCVSYTYGSSAGPHAVTSVGNLVLNWDISPGWALSFAASLIDSKGNQLGRSDFRSDMIAGGYDWYLEATLSGSIVPGENYYVEVYAGLRHGKERPDSLPWATSIPKYYRINLKTGSVGAVGDPLWRKFGGSFIGAW